MSSFNQATLVGNLGADPEVRSTTSGDRVATFSLATSEQWNDEKGNPRERTEWHRCVAWNKGNRKLADLVERYLVKGAKVLVQGAIRYKQWTDKENVERYSTEIEISQLTFLSAKAKTALERDE